MKISGNDEKHCLGVSVNESVASKNFESLEGFSKWPILVKLVDFFLTSNFPVFKSEIRSH